MCCDSAEHPQSLEIVELKSVPVFKVYPVCCSSFVLCFKLSHKYTSPMLVRLAQKDIKIIKIIYTVS